MAQSSLISVVLVPSFGFAIYKERAVQGFDLRGVQQQDLALDYTGESGWPATLPQSLVSTICTPSLSGPYLINGGGIAYIPNEPYLANLCQRMEESQRVQEGDVVISFFSHHGDQR